MSIPFGEKLELLAGAITGRQLAAGAAPWLTQPLVRTNVARERLRTWCVAGGMSQPPLSRADIVDRLAYVGSEAVAVPIVLALEAMAPPARDYVLDHVQFVALDFDEGGWCGSVRLPRELRHSIVIRRSGTGDAADLLARRITLHECAHAWLEPHVTSPEENRIRRQARRQAQSEGRLYSALDAPVELRAWCLVEAWEGRPLDWFPIRKALQC